MQLSQKPKTFLGLFFPFLKFTFKFEHFEKKDHLIADVLFNLRTPKNLVR